jgi:lipopolysaccharide/colanic/teichoic acid biosynthesis glycosyltransferase
MHRTFGGAGGVVPTGAATGAARALANGTPKPAKAPPPSFVTGGISEGHYRWKRVFDFVFAIVLLIVLSPVLLLIALAIKLDSPGPVLFVQDRMGSRRRKRGGRVEWELRSFRFWKFRSMACNVSESLHEDHIENFCNGRVACKPKDDPRITRLGRFLRKSSLDELPQLINVVRGEMSLVGPRPVPLYDERCYERFAAPGGITGLWQVEGRGRVPFQEMIRMDVEYVRTSSPWVDLKIMMRTLPAVVSRKGAV